MRLLAALLCILLVGCSRDSDPVTTPEPEPTLAMSVPPGFEVDVFIDDVDLPTSLAFPPDGSNRLFVNELQSGRVWIYEDGERLDDPFVRVTTNTSGDFPVDGENGLLGIAFDPSYSTNRFVYLTYAYRSDEGTFGRIVRYTDSGNRATEELVLLDGFPAAPGHQIESLAFGPDDKLYVSIGDAYLNERVQVESDVLGKVIRMNRDGTIPADNPFPDSYTYALGFRNCFDLVFLDGGELVTTCNGPEWNDEMNIVERGANYGWPLWTGEGRMEGYVDPIHVWHGVVSPTGMLVYRGTQFPTRYRGKLFQVLFGATNSPGASTVAKRVQVVDLTSSGGSMTAAFDDFLVYKFEDRGNPVDITEGPDGSLYLSDIFQGRIYRIRYVG